MSFAAVVFDFDGVLLESLDIKTQAFAKLYESYGESVVRRVVDFHQTHGGVSRFDKIRHIENVFLGLDATEDQILEKAEIFSRLVEDAVVSCPEVPGATEALRFFSSQSPCFIASATPEPELRRIVHRRGMNDFFTGVFGAPVTKKVILQEIIRSINKPAYECLMIGDAMADFEAATLCGMRFVGRVPFMSSSPFPSSVLYVKDMQEMLQVASVGKLAVAG